jgi:hypothetical protein
LINFHIFQIDIKEERFKSMSTTIARKDFLSITATIGEQLKQYVNLSHSFVL